ncbi:phage holin family protein [Buttiauxella selenatireducens]|uniref:Phage holin family protein n=1 Tax=Buttiauxella selenatireducens TaxID=3073902 RepID=A0ABY9S5S0_9ENTR|nr:phage holin family protein [Buttiauxella sp. R73]WMY72747.1 phage holin family protein [Buttiauxella sp. R73]
MTIDLANIWLQANAVIATLIVIVIASYQRRNSRHKPFYSFIAWLAMIALISIPIRVWVGNYDIADRSEVIVNFILLLVMLNSRGNITGRR